MKESCLEEALLSLLLPIFAAFHMYLASVVLGSILRRFGTPVLGVRQCRAWMLLFIKWAAMCYLTVYVIKLILNRSWKILMIWVHWLILSIELISFNFLKSLSSSDTLLYHIVPPFSCLFMKNWSVENNNDGQKGLKGYSSEGGVQGHCFQSRKETSDAT